MRSPRCKRTSAIVLVKRGVRLCELQTAGDPFSTLSERHGDARRASPVSNLPEMPEPDFKVFFWDIDQFVFRRAKLTPLWSAPLEVDTDQAAVLPVCRMC